MNALNAAERQKIIEDFERLTLADYKQLRAELAAANEKLRVAEEALDRIADTDPDDTSVFHDIANGVLAKIREVK